MNAWTARLIETVTATISGITPPFTAKSIKTVAFSLAATGDAIAAVSSKKIKVLGYSMQSINDTMTAQFRDGGAGALVSQLWTFNAREGVSKPALPPNYWTTVVKPIYFETTAGNALQLVITGTGTIKGEVTYFDDDAS